jgi:dipeptidyl aminopeptidase/acylaminoacyl peptidase
MGSPSVRGIYVGDVERTVSRRLLDADTPAAYLANHLLYVRQGTLFAQRFDPVQLDLEGDPRPVGERVVSGTRANIAALSTSPAGLIAYRMGPSGGRRQLVWVNRSGREIARIGDRHGFGPSYMSISPDSRRLAVQRTQDGNTDIWVLDLDHNTPIRFTSDLDPDIAPMWSPAGDRLVFSSRKDRFNLYERPIAGRAADELLLATEQTKSATDWSHDERFLLYRSLDPQLNWDVWAMPMHGDRKPFAVVRTKFGERDARFSPDGKWIAYQSNESGRFEIYAQPFQGTGARRRISTDGGVQPQWSRDGRELFYLALDGRLVAVPVDLSPSGATLTTGTPVPLFVANLGGVQDIPLNLYLVSSDSQRFLLDTIVEEAASPIVVVVNWKPAAN